MIDSIGFIVVVGNIVLGLYFGLIKSEYSKGNFHLILGMFCIVAYISARMI